MTDPKQKLGYIGFFGDRPQFEVYADSLYDAKVKAVAHFKPSKAKAHLVSVHLVEFDDQPVTQVLIN